MASPAYTECCAVVKNTFLELASVEVALEARPRALSDLTWSLKPACNAVDEAKECYADEVCSVATSKGSTTLSSTTSWSECESDDDDSACSDSLHSARSPPCSFSVCSHTVEGTRPASRVSTGKPSAGKTSLMLRNIPAHFSRHDLLALLAAHNCLMDARFLYLPLESDTGSAFGYAFIAFANADVADRFRNLLDGTEMSTGKVLHVDWCSSHMNAQEQVERFRNSPLMHPSVPDAIRPIVLLNGVRAEFPAPTKKLRVPRQRDQQRIMRHASKLTSPTL